MIQNSDGCLCTRKPGGLIWRLASSKGLGEVKIRAVPALPVCGVWKAPIAFVSLNNLLKWNQVKLNSQPPWRQKGKLQLEGCAWTRGGRFPPELGCGGWKIVHTCTQVFFSTICRIVLRLSLAHSPFSATPWARYGSVVASSSLPTDIKPCEFLVKYLCISLIFPPRLYVSNRCISTIIFPKQYLPRSEEALSIL